MWYSTLQSVWISDNATLTYSYDCKCSVNPIINPNFVYSHSYTWKYDLQCECVHFCSIIYIFIFIGDRCHVKQICNSVNYIESYFYLCVFKQFKTYVITRVCENDPFIFLNCLLVIYLLSIPHFVISCFFLLSLLLPCVGLGILHGCVAVNISWMGSLAPRAIPRLEAKDYT
jgi:hypothetical protein